MSGGSMDYLYVKVAEVAGRLQVDENYPRRQFGDHLLLVAKALHDIEWVDSGDYSPDQDLTAIEAALWREQP